MKALGLLLFACAASPQMLPEPPKISFPPPDVPHTRPALQQLRITPPPAPGEPATAASARAIIQQLKIAPPFSPGKPAARALAGAIVQQRKITLPPSSPGKVAMGVDSRPCSIPLVNVLRPQKEMSRMPTMAPRPDSHSMHYVPLPAAPCEDKPR
jgi:hypothetical protein